MFRSFRWLIAGAALLWGAVATMPSSAQAIGVLSNNLSGSVTSGSASTFQSVSVQNTGRKGCLIENPPTATETLFVFFGPIANATSSSAVALSPGASVTCGMTGDYVVGDQVSVSAATNPHAFVAAFQ